MTKPFWQTKSLSEMSVTEWESLCDGCGKCCLHKLENEDTGEVFYTNVRCKLLEPNSCRCTDYLNRVTKVPTCVILNPNVIATLPFMPFTCSYRLVFEGKDLPAWHHLVCGDKERVHTEGHSVRGKTIDEQSVKDWEDQIFPEINS